MTMMTTTIVRDPRFIADHRGGLLGSDDHRALARWAADCAERLLPVFEEHSADPRPREAVATARRWAEGDATVGEARRASVAAHACARETKDPAAVAVARAAGHAVATAHMADHSPGPVIYGAKALAATGGSIEDEVGWQIGRLPPHLRGMVVTALSHAGLDVTAPVEPPPRSP